MSRLIRLKNNGRHADCRQIVEETQVFLSNTLKQLRFLMIGPQTAGLLQFRLNALIGNRCRQTKIEIHVRQPASGQG